MPAARSLRIATFNAGLAVGVLPYASERMPHVADAIAALEADVVFLQEIWLESHWLALRSVVAKRFPFAFRPAATQPAVHGACSEEELADLVACARTHCADLQSDELGRCVLRRCGHLAASLSTECLNCVVSHPVGTLDEILAPCLGLGAGAATPPPARIRGEASVYGPAGLLAYGGSFGTAFLSTTELHDCDVLVYDTTTVNARGALYARVDAPGIGDLHVFGTHLSPGIHEEQTRQIDELFAWIDEKAGAHAPAIVVGDLNTGPTVGGGRTSASHVPSLYRRFADAGFANPYLEGGAAKCTYCHGSLSTGNHGTSGWVIDHVLVRDVPGSAFGERILDEPLAFDAAGRRIVTTYSDHCGVRLTIDASGTARARTGEAQTRGEP